MPRRAPKTSLQERRTILARSQAGQTAPHIAADLGWSVHTVRKWRRIARHNDDAALSPRIGRAPTGALSTFPPALSAAIRRLRQDHPGWGPRTLLLDLQRDPYWSTQPLPSRTQIAAFLKQQGLTRSYHKHRDLPRPPRDGPSEPHQEWQLDAQGAMTVAGVGSVSVINIVDVVSRLKVESFPDVEHSQPATPAYQLSLRRAFSAFGLPERVTFDHGSAFYDNTTPSPFPTLLHLWLIALGIVVLFTRKRRPTDHAQVERTHQIMTGQALLGQRWGDQASLWAGLDERREVLNQALPMRVLGGQAPLSAYPEAHHSGREYRAEWEAQLLEVKRVDEYLAQGEWFRQTNCHGEFWLGQQRYNAGRKFAKVELGLRYDAATREVVGRVVGRAEEVRWPIKGLSVEELMGEAGAVAGLPAYQLALPLTAEAWRQAQYAQAQVATAM